MELVQKNIHFNHVTKEAGNQITLEEDINIPETKEDIEAVLFSDYNVVIEDVKVQDGKVHIRGKLYYSILYRSEETGRLCNLKGSIPLDEQLYMEGVMNSDKIMVKSRVEDFSVGTINSRKISIQSILELNAYVQELFDEQVTTAVNSEECEIYQKECDFTQLTVCKKDVLRLRESVTLPNNMPNVEEIVFSSVKVCEPEYKPLEGQLSVQGKIQMFVIYDGERNSQNQMYQITIPFGTMLECSGSNLNMIFQVCHKVMDAQVHLESDFDDEARSFAVDISMELDIKLYEQQKVRVLWDLYGIQKEFVPNVQFIKYDVLNGHYCGSVKVSEKLDLNVPENSRIRVLHSVSNALLDKSEITDEGIVLKGVVSCQVLYVTGEEEQEYECAYFMMPFDKIIEGTEKYAGEKVDCNVCIEGVGLQVSADMSGNMEATAKVSYNVLVFEKVNGRNIIGVETKETDMEKWDRLPSMAVCFVSSNESLWDMGKKYRVPIKQIKEMNQLSSDEIREGDKILIVRGMCS